MIKPIREDDLARQAIEELTQQVNMTEAVLVKVLDSLGGTIEVTQEQLEKPVADNIIVDMTINEQTQVWTIALKEAPEAF